jgi:NADPH:quinone reductase-like Zn-dependent oxidoreductase
MATTLTQFYKQLDALDANNEEACLRFATHFDKILRNEFAQMRLTEVDLKKADVLGPNEQFNDAEVNAPGSIFAVIKVPKFLDFNKVNIDRVIKLAQLNNTIAVLFRKDTNNPVLESFQKTIGSIFSYAASIQRKEQPEDRVIDDAKTELTQQLKNETDKEKIRVINRSLGQLNDLDYMKDLKKEGCLNSFLCPEISNDPSCYQLRTEYVVGKHVVLFEQRAKELDDITTNIMALNSSFLPYQQKETRLQLSELVKKFKSTDNFNNRSDIIQQAKEIEQDLDFRMQIRTAKKHIDNDKMSSTKEKQNGHHYLSSLTESFSDEKSFAKREIVLDAAKKTNAYLAAPADKKEAAKQDLLATTKQLKHVSHGKKVVGALAMFVGAVALVAGIGAAVATGGASLLVAAAGVATMVQGAVTVKESTSTMQKPAKQALAEKSTFFKAAAAGNNIKPAAPKGKMISEDDKENVVPVTKMKRPGN